MTGMLGSRVVASEPLRWGFDAASRLVTLDSGRRVVVQRRRVDPGGAGTTLGSHALSLGSVIGVLQAAGIVVPTLLASSIEQGHEWLVFAQVDGVPGPELLADPRRGPLLAASMGRIARTLATVPVESVSRGSDAWSTVGALREGCGDWLEVLGDGAPSFRATQLALDHVTRSPWTVAVSHGDFVPANVLVGDDDTVALLDLGDVAVRHPLLDVAWWLLIVRHHHPSLAPGLATPLLAAAGLDGAAPGAMMLASVALLRALQLAARRTPGSAREHQLQLVRAAVVWAARA